jgi:hypothetical protein
VRHLLFIFLLLPNVVSAQNKLKLEIYGNVGVALPVGAFANNQPADILYKTNDALTDTFSSCCAYSEAGYGTAGTIVTAGANLLFNSKLGIEASAVRLMHQRRGSSGLNTYYTSLFPAEFYSPTTVDFSDVKVLGWLIGPTYRLNISKINVQLGVQAGQALSSYPIFEISAETLTEPIYKSAYTTAINSGATTSALFSGSIALKYTLLKKLSVNLRTAYYRAGFDYQQTIKDSAFSAAGLAEDTLRYSSLTFSAGLAIPL